jgi:hypothetical protein
MSAGDEKKPSTLMTCPTCGRIVKVEASEAEARTAGLECIGSDAEPHKARALVVATVN